MACYRIQLVWKGRFLNVFPFSDIMQNVFIGRSAPRWSDVESRAGLLPPKRWQSDDFWRCVERIWHGLGCDAVSHERKSFMCAAAQRTISAGLFSTFSATTFFLSALIPRMWKYQPLLYRYSFDHQFLMIPYIHPSSLIFHGCMYLYLSQIQWGCGLGLLSCWNTQVCFIPSNIWRNLRQSPFITPHTSMPCVSVLCCKSDPKHDAPTVML